MANLLLRHIYKIYPGVGKVKKNAKAELKKRSGDFVAVKDFNMEISDGEFIVFCAVRGDKHEVLFRANVDELSAWELLSLEGVVLTAPDLEHGGAVRTIIAYYKYYL